MTLSNLGVWGLTVWHWTWDEFSWLPKTLSTLGVLGLTIGRQREVDFTWLWGRSGAAQELVENGGKKDL